MEPICTSDMMRRAEKAAGVPMLTLMERACDGIAHSIPRNAVAAFACGTGMNGGDGFGAAARHAEKGGKAYVWRVPKEEDLYGDAKIEYERCKKAGCVLFDRDSLNHIPVPDIWVDALFGIGLSRPVEGIFAEGIARMNGDREKGATVLSVDIPSGISANTGNILGCCVQADTTVTFGMKKCGHLLGDGLEASGNVIVCDIGTPVPPDAFMMAQSPAFPPRKRNTHKGTYGTLLIWAGSFGMAGAAAICANAALRGGCGLVSIACPEKIVSIVQTLSPCATCVPLPEDADEALSIFQAALVGKSAIAAGPGLSQMADKRLLECVLDAPCPAVLDADALNLLAKNPKLMEKLTMRHVITPHPGEAARLLGHFPADPVKDCRALADMGCVALLKGATSVISSEHTAFSATGSPGMAKGGSGDALTGILGSFLAQGIAPETAAQYASELHGRAGEIAAARFGERSMLATDLVSCIGEAFQSFA